MGQEETTPAVVLPEVVATTTTHSVPITESPVVQTTVPAIVPDTTQPSSSAIVTTVAAVIDAIVTTLVPSDGSPSTASPDPWEVTLFSFPSDTTLSPNSMTLFPLNPVNGTNPYLRSMDPVIITPVDDNGLNLGSNESHIIPYSYHRSITRAFEPMSDMDVPTLRFSSRGRNRTSDPFPSERMLPLSPMPRSGTFYSSSNTSLLNEEWARPEARSALPPGARSALPPPADWARSSSERVYRTSSNGTSPTRMPVPFGVLQDADGKVMRRRCRCIEKKRRKVVKDIKYVPLVPVVNLAGEKRNFTCKCSHLRRIARNLTLLT